MNKEFEPHLNGDNHPIPTTIENDSECEYWLNRIEELMDMSEDVLAHTPYGKELRELSEIVGKYEDKRYPTEKITFDELGRRGPYCKLVTFPVEVTLKKLILKFLTLEDVQRNKE